MLQQLSGDASRVMENYFQNIPEMRILWRCHLIPVTRGNALGLIYDTELSNLSAPMPIDIVTFVSLPGSQLSIDDETWQIVSMGSIPKKNKSIGFTIVGSLI